jgi:hypothetical protein
MASKKFWDYVGVNVQLIIILFIPSIGVTVPLFFVKELLLKWAVIAIFSIPLTYLGTIYMFAPLMVVFDNGNKPYFKRSKRLVKGNIWKIIILTGIVSAAPCYLYIYKFHNYRGISPVSKYVIQIIYQLLFVFVTPLVRSIYVTLFCRLKENNKIT